MDAIPISNPSKLPSGVLKEYAGLSVAEAIAKYVSMYGHEPEAIFAYKNSAGMMSMFCEVPASASKDTVNA